MDAIYVAERIIFLLVQGFSELLKSYWAAKKGEWPGVKK